MCHPEKLLERTQPAVKIGITCYSSYGGSGIVASELGLELAARGHEVHFICATLPLRLSRMPDHMHFHEVEATNYALFDTAPYALALAVRMAEVALEYELDLLHVHYAIPHSVSAFLAREMLKDTRPVPFITTLHGTDITLVGTDRSYLPITRFAIRQSDGVTSVSEYLRAETCREFDICTDTPIEVIPNFINSQTYRRIENPALRATFAKPDEPILVHVSNFRAVKRTTDCIRIAARLNRQLPVQLIMVGDGPERAQAQWLARQKGIADRVHFVGKQPDIPAYLSLADVLLLPSESESFGLAALEAMACEVPVIASCTGGVPELVTPGETGFLAEVGDIQAMADHAQRLLTDADLRHRMRQACRRVAVERFNANDIVTRYEAYYRRVIEQFRARRG